jgi:hypothetical protein
MSASVAFLMPVEGADLSRPAVSTVKSAAPAGRRVNLSIFMGGKSWE